MAKLLESLGSLSALRPRTTIIIIPFTRFRMALQWVNSVSGRFKWDLGKRGNSMGARRSEYFPLESELANCVFL